MTRQAFLFHIFGAILLIIGLVLSYIHFPGFKRLIRRIAKLCFWFAFDEVVWRRYIRAGDTCRQGAFSYLNPKIFVVRDIRPIHDKPFAVVKVVTVYEQGTADLQFFGLDELYPTDDSKYEALKRFQGE